MTTLIPISTYSTNWHALTYQIHMRMAGMYSVHLPSLLRDFKRRDFKSEQIYYEMLTY